MQKLGQHLSIELESEPQGRFISRRTCLDSGQ